MSMQPEHWAFEPMDGGNDLAISEFGLVDVDGLYSRLVSGEELTPDELAMLSGFIAPSKRLGGGQNA